MPLIPIAFRNNSQILGIGNLLNVYNYPELTCISRNCVFSPNLLRVPGPLSTCGTDEPCIPEAGSAKHWEMAELGKGPKSVHLILACICNGKCRYIHTFKLPLMVASEDKDVIYVTCLKGVRTSAINDGQFCLSL